MPSHQYDWKELAAQLIARALQGAITITEFHSLWTTPPESGSVASLFYNDLENAIEHFPGTWMGQPDTTAWRNSDLFRRIVVDQALLGLSVEDRDILRLRDSLLADPALDLSTLSRRINALRGID